MSHISDILEKGRIYAVENSPISMKKLLNVCEKRSNVIPILNDAFHLERYEIIVPTVDFVYQDISQRNQAEIFIENIQKYLGKKGKAILMVKARSIDVSLKPKKVYDDVCSKLKKEKLKIFDVIDLSPYEKDHAAILVGV